MISLQLDFSPHGIEPTVPPFTGKVLQGLGVIGALEWVLRISFWTGAVSGWPHMKLDSALGFLALGGFLRWRQTHAGRARVWAAVAVAIGAVSLAREVFWVPLGVDQWPVLSVTARAGAVGWWNAPSSTALCFILLGGTAWLERVPKVMHAMVWAAAIVSFAKLLEELFAVDAYTATIFRFNNMGMICAFGVQVACVGCWARYPGVGFMRILTSDSSGGKVARGLFPFTIVIPVLLPWFFKVCCVEWGWLDHRQAGVSLIICTMVTLLTAVTVIASRLIKEERRRSALEEKIFEAQKLEAVGQLAGGIAHDFNNVLTSVLGYANLLIGDPALSEAHRADVKQIAQAGDRASKLTRELLAFSRKQVMSHQVVELDLALKGLKGVVQHLVGEGVQVEWQLAGQAGRVKVDLVKLEQVVLNIAANARDAMPQGGRLTFSTRPWEGHQEDLGPLVGLRSEPYLVLSIMDAGVGMSPEVMARAMEPYFTTKESGKGTGLGLASVYGIMKQMGGAVRLESQVGKGTTVTLFFPRTDDAVSIAGSKVHENPRRGRETILLAEDDEAVREMTAVFLRKLGYTVFESSDGQKALLQAKSMKGSIHLLLSDVVMPGMNGLELARQIRVCHPETAILMMSGYAGNVLSEMGMEKEKIHVLEKPFVLEVLSDRIRQMLDSSMVS